jgi:hypothetical protein
MEIKNKNDLKMLDYLINKVIKNICFFQVYKINNYYPIEKKVKKLEKMYKFSLLYTIIKRM